MFFLNHVFVWGTVLALSLLVILLIHRQEGKEVTNPQAFRIGRVVFLVIAMLAAACLGIAFIEHISVIFGRMLAEFWSGFPTSEDLLHRYDR